MAIGERLGPYELVELVGEGGMGEVWKARDTRLGRNVAIKRLHGPISSRFEQEARAVSALNHPHICALYDVGIDGGTPYLVMEYVEGERLAGPVSVREAIRLGVQIASALSAAHRAGIVHRDLKPANVLVGSSGVKLVDFGLAKREGLPGPADATPRTREGMLVGTLQYMSPEQLEGKDADARSDIFAFGLLLYELLTGRRAFDARSQAGVIAAVMHNEPAPLTTLAPDVPPALDRLVRRALEKDPERRWQTVEAVKDALEWLAETLTPSMSPAAARPAGSGRRLTAWMLGAAGAAALATVAVVLLGPWRRVAPPERLQVEVALPSELTIGFDSLIALAPNGRSFVVNASKTLWLRSLEDGSLRALAGTTGAMLPFWSPDGTHVAFFADGRLKTLRLPDSAPEIVAEAPNPRGGAWSRDGIIVFAPQALGPLLQVSASGGAPRPVTTLDQSRQEDQHSAPVFLPDGRRFLYHARSRLRDNSALALGSVDADASAPTQALAAADSGGWYAPPAGRGDGYLVFLRRRNLLVQRVDLDSMKPTGDATVLARRVRVMADSVANMSVAARGQLVYVADEPRVNQPRWYSRDGTLLSSVGDLGEYMAARASPSGALLATVRADPVDFGRSVWILDMARNVDRQIGVDGNMDDPVWSPDSERIAFAWMPPGEEMSNVHEVRPDRPGGPRALVPPGAIRWPLDWSPDSRTVIYAQIDPVSKFDIWAVPADGSGEPVAVVRGPGKDNEARFSPDGRFIAYQSDEIRETRVYITPYPPTGRQIPISEGTGSEPRWRRDGRELYYIAGDGALVAVPISINGTDLSAGRPVRLFGGRDSRLRVWHFDPGADGNRFLVLSLNDGVDATPVHFVSGWQ
jgi:Tol biopolymer transport system component